MTDRQLIEFGARELAARFGFGDLKVMRQRDLEYLCERVKESSGILISLSTIKRILNGQYNRLPQVATLNAIALCLGYADWQGFKTAKAAESVDVRAVVSVEEGATEVVRSRKVLKVVGAGTALILLVVILSWSYFTRSPANGDSTATFTIRKTTQNTIPNTVVFTYDIDRVSGDSFFIQQSWDKNRRVRIYKRSHTLTDIYYEPGYHVAKLFANDRILKTIDVSIPTDEWFFYSKESLTRGLPAYIHTNRPIRNGILGLDRQALIANKIDPEKSQVYLATFFPTAIGADADNFRLRARLRLTEIRNTACPFIMTEVYCQRRFTYCMFTVPGCTGGIGAQFGDQVVDGKNNDLSALAYEVRQWHDLEMLVRNRQVTVSIDGKAVLTKVYTASSGLITGLGFHSNGLCEADSIRLAGLDGKGVYPQ
jgi:transcriptional regulator with XRE-family HTH domain